MNSQLCSIKHRPDADYRPFNQVEMLGAKPTARTLKWRWLAATDPFVILINREVYGEFAVVISHAF
jgi:hypothetical protein